MHLDFSKHSKPNFLENVFLNNNIMKDLKTVLILLSTRMLTEMHPNYKCF